MPLFILLLATSSAWTAEGDPEGWSVRTDFPQRRAFLLWTPLSDGPRVLAIDCVPGNTLGIFSEDVAEDLVNKSATLSLANGRAKFEVLGDVICDSRTGRGVLSGVLKPAMRADCGLSATSFCRFSRGRGLSRCKSGQGLQVCFQEQA